jgi:hypothetical protein
MLNQTYAFVVDAVGPAVNSPTTVYRTTDICTRGFRGGLASAARMER